MAITRVGFGGSSAQYATFPFADKSFAVGGTGNLALLGVGCWLLWFLVG